MILTLTLLETPDKYSALGQQYSPSLTSYHTVSVNESPRGFCDSTHCPVQSSRATSAVSAVHSVGSPGAYLRRRPGRQTAAEAAATLHQATTRRVSSQARRGRRRRRTSKATAAVDRYVVGVTASYKARGTPQSNEEAEAEAEAASAAPTKLASACGQPASKPHSHLALPTLARGGEETHKHILREERRKGGGRGGEGGTIWPLLTVPYRFELRGILKTKPTLPPKPRRTKPAEYNLFPPHITFLWPKKNGEWKGHGDFAVCDDEETVHAQKNAHDAKRAPSEKQKLDALAHLPRICHARPSHQIK